MSVRLVILGLLHRKPLYGYEIKHIIEDHMGDWTSIAFGSIYFALEKLAKEKFVERVGIEQEGKRPSRSVYQITDAGRGEFLHLLRVGWKQVEQQYFPLDICLFFMDSLPLEEVKEYLRIRKGSLQETVGYIQSHCDEQLQVPQVPHLARAIFDHSLVHTKAELAWVTDLLQKLESGEYP
ncbi:MAG: PadR family transcriptional regulator [Anaerolineaceae bacterium]|nr:PadR family transcriptional regulator [Anaerolineaceae bacterium]MBN2677449.1 PadR family transcriptional regulator [Anaerolineaceae bacterium]